MRCFIFVLALTAGCFRTTLGPRFYVTQPATSYHDSTADSVQIHIDEKLLIRLNATLLLGRKEQLEQAACLRVERSDARGIWLDSMLTASIDPGMTTLVQVSFTCNDHAVPYHTHVVYERDGWDQCEPSPADRAPILAAFPAEVLQCGFGVDSIIAYRVRRR